MPVKRRIDKRRDVVISDRAIAIFREMRAVTRRCTCGPDDSIDKCSACEQWYDLHSELHRELNLPPWIWPCLRPILGECSDRRCVGVYRSWVSQRGLWLLLREAERAAKNSTMQEQPCPVTETGAPSLN
jgi:hypothetical protein